MLDSGLIRSFFCVISPLSTIFLLFLKKIHHMDIVGRKTELKDFERFYASGKPEFIAVYGRRRVGKTFLIKT